MVFIYIIFKMLTTAQRHTSQQRRQFRQNISYYFRLFFFKRNKICRPVCMYTTRLIYIWRLVVILIPSYLYCIIIRSNVPGKNVPNTHINVVKYKRCAIRWYTYVLCSILCNALSSSSHRNGYRIKRRPCPCWP